MTSLQQRYDGVNFDLKNVPEDLQSAHTSFLEKAGGRLGNSFLLGVTVPAKTLGDIDWHQGFNFRRKHRLPGNCHGLQGTLSGGSPGPVAALPWLKRLLDYTVRMLLPEKTSVDFGIYGIDWEKDCHGRTSDLASMERLVKRTWIFTGI